MGFSRSNTNDLISICLFENVIWETLRQALVLAELALREGAWRQSDIGSIGCKPTAADHFCPGLLCQAISACKSGTPPLGSIPASDERSQITFWSIILLLLLPHAWQRLGPTALPVADRPILASLE